MELYENLPCHLEIIAWAAGHGIVVIISNICILIQKNKVVQKIMQFYLLVISRIQQFDVAVIVLHLKGF